MRTISILINKTLVPDEFQQALTNCREFTEQTLCIKTAYKSAEWTSEDGGCTLQLWSNEKLLWPSDPLILSEHGNALAYSGYWYSKSHGSAAELFSALLTHNPVDVIRNVHGAYAIFFYRASDRKLHIFNTISCQPVVFFQDNRRYTAVSTRGLALALLAEDKRGSLNYDLESLAGMVATGYFVSDRIPYRETSLLPPNSHLVADNRSVAISELDDTIANLGRGDAVITDAFLDEFCSIFIDMVKKVAGEHEIRIGLSGGRDSRMVLAALYGSGINVSAVTNGWRNGPDMIIASMLCEALGIPHTRHEVEVSGETDALPFTPLNRFRREFYYHDTLYISPPERPVNIPQFNPRHKSTVWPGTVFFAGTGAEMLRGGLGIRSRANARQMDAIPQGFSEALVRKEWLSNLEFLRPDVATSYRDWVEEWITRNCRNRPEDGILEHLYIHNWAARGRGAIMINHDSAIINLMTDSGLFKLSQQLHPYVRSSERLFFEVIRRMAPQIANLPLNDERWAFEMKGPRSGEETEYQQRAPIRREKVGASSNATYTSAGVDSREAFERLLLRNTDCPIYSVVQKTRVTELFDSGRIYDYRSSYLAWRFLGAAELCSNMWLSNDDLTDAPIRVRHAVRWDQINIAIGRLAATITEQFSEVGPAVTYLRERIAFYADNFRVPEAEVDALCRSIILATGGSLFDLVKDDIPGKLDAVRITVGEIAEAMFRFIQVTPDAWFGGAEPVKSTKPGIKVMEGGIATA